MNRPLLEKIVSALLYNGYVFYPSRPSIKGRRRLASGGLLPRSCFTANDGAEGWTMRTECLVRGGPDTTLRVEARFLHLLEAKIGVVESGESDDLDETPPRYVDHYDCGGAHLHAQQEAEECDRKMAIGFDGPARGEIQIEVSDFEYPARQRRETVRDERGAIGAVIVREQQTLAGSMEVGVASVADGLFKVRVQIENRTMLDDADRVSRAEAALAALISTHAILSVENGEFLSMTDPPAECRGLTANMHNVGCWPVLVGDEGQHDTMLASPIMLDDYPQIGCENPT